MSNILESTPDRPDIKSHLYEARDRAIGVAATVHNMTFDGIPEPVHELVERTGPRLAMLGSKVAGRLYDGLDYLMVRGLNAIVSDDTPEQKGPRRW